MRTADDERAILRDVLGVNDLDIREEACEKEGMGSDEQKAEGDQREGGISRMKLLLSAAARCAVVRPHRAWSISPDGAGWGGMARTAWSQRSDGRQRGEWPR